MTGSNNFVDYGPRRLLDKDVVLVSINYRLGPFGYLSLGSDQVPGNAGMLDQVLALKWVQDNIEYFHGDPNMVTIFGESAGSLSIAFHILSPKSKGLFQRAILQSGTALGYSWGGYVPADKALYYSNLFASNLGCEEGDLACLQSRDMSDIIMQSYMISNLTDYVLDYGTNWLPVMDAELTDEVFLPGSPQDLLASGQFNSEVDVIIGSNKDEGLLWMINEIFDESVYGIMSADWDIYGPMRIFNIADPNDITQDQVEKARALLKFYTGGNGSYEPQYFEQLDAMFTDAFPLFAVHQTMKAFLEQNMMVFHYILTYKGEFSILDTYGLPPMGVCHADDLIYLFDPVFQKWGLDPDAGVLTGTDLEVADLMVSAWTNFATFGDPTPPSDTQMITWLPASPGIYQYLNISGTDAHMEYSEDVKARMEFWTELMK